MPSNAEDKAQLAAIRHIHNGYINKEPFIYVANEPTSEIYVLQRWYVRETMISTPTKYRKVQDWQWEVFCGRRFLPQVSFRFR